MYGLFFPHIGRFEEVSLVSNSGKAFLFVLYDQKKKKKKHSGGKMAPVNCWI